MAEMLSDLAIVRPASPRSDTNNKANKESEDSYPDGEDNDQSIFHFLASDQHDCVREAGNNRARNDRFGHLAQAQQRRQL